MIFCLFLTLLIACASAHVLAEDIADVFQIEIIFFEHKDSKRFSAEQWPKYVGTLDAKNAIDLSTLPIDVPDSVDTLQILDALDEVTTEPVKKVIPETITLVEPNKRLLNNEENLLKASKEQRFIDHVAWNQPLAWNVKSTPVFIKAGKDSNEIQCLVSIKPAKGLYNVNIDMICKTGVREFRLTQDVKLKKKEVFYIDHPILGAIIEVSPVVEEY